MPQTEIYVVGEKCVSMVITSEIQRLLVTAPSVRTRSARARGQGEEIPQGRGTWWPSGLREGAGDGEGQCASA